MEKKNNRQIIAIGVLALTLILSGAIAVSYFLTGVSNDNSEVLTVNTGSLSLIFDDNNDGMQIVSLMIGESVSKEVKITNNGDLPVTTNLNWKDLTNTYLAKSLVYKVQYKTSAEGTWVDITAEHPNVPTSETETEVTILKDITIPAQTTYYYKITITFENTDENQENDRKAMLATKFNLGEYFKALSSFEKSVKHLNIEVNSTTPNFTSAATTDEGVFAMEDDYGTSYYYRGAVTNNYVKFGGFYWRIIRINGDGSLRMIYDGTKYYSNGETNDLRYAVTGVRWAIEGQSLADDTKYVGYMYGIANTSINSTTHSTSAKEAQTNIVDSNAKFQVDEWYKNNMLTNVANDNKDLTSYLADSIFCNDRSMPTGGEVWWTKQTSQANLGWSTHNTPYGPFSRFINPNDAWKTPAPTFKCPDNTTTGNEQINKNNDRFTVSDIKLGNGNLTYPVGLITADEIVAAGSGKGGTTNKVSYLYKSLNYKGWSLSPSYFNGTYARIFGIRGTGQFYGDYADYESGAVAPVINLKAEYAQQLIGTGVKDDEYRLEGVN